MSIVIETLVGLLVGIAAIAAFKLGDLKPRWLGLIASVAAWIGFWMLIDIYKDLP